MGVKQIPTEIFIKYLKSIGLVFIRKDQWHHDLYDYPDNHPNGKLARSVAVRTKYKEIPRDHIHTNLFSAGKTKSEFEEWLKNPKKSKKTKL